MPPNSNVDSPSTGAEIAAKSLVGNLVPRAGVVEVVLTALSFIGFAIGGGILSWLVCPLAYLSSTDSAVRQMRCRKLVSLGFRGFHWWLHNFKVIRFQPGTFSPKLDELKRTPCIVVANHPTLVDVTAIMAAWPELCHVAKPGLFRNPFVGPLLRMCGHLPGNDAGRAVLSGTHKALDTAVQRVKSGESLLIFPEGTRSPHDRVGKFHRGAFEIAVRANVNVVSLLVTTSRPFLTKEQAWCTIPTVVRALDVEILSTLCPTQFPPSGSRKLRDKVIQEFKVAMGIANAEPG